MNRRSSILKHIAALMMVLTMALSVSMVSAQSNPVQDGTIKIPRTVKDETVLPSPEAAKMGTLPENTVSYNRGVVNISRQLLTLQSGTLAMPVSISYNTQGIKVDDDNCLVGLGWTLDCGGSITRTIKGRPDELREFQLKTVSQIEADNNVAYLKDVMRGAIDADYDRYNYSVGGYSGSFIITDGSIVQLPKTDLTIELTGEEREGVRDFKITTPNGEQYWFTAREHTDYHYSPATVTANTSYISPDYSAVSGWHLTKALSANRSDSIMLEYATSRHVRVDITDNLYSASMSYDGHSYSFGNSHSGISSTATTSYPDKRIPKRITGRGFTLDISTDSINHYRRISQMTLRNVKGDIVKQVKFNASLYNDGRIRFDSYSIESDGKKTDGASFGYNITPTTRSSKDFFGYNNYVYSTSYPYESVLNDNLTPSQARAYNFDSAKAGLLTSITDFTGATTTFTYEPSEAISGGHTVHIGVRIKKICINGRNYVREFAYEDAATTINFGSLSTNDFLSTSGSRWGTLTSSGYSTGTSFTASCRVPGNVEGATIYYGKVTETISGTAIDTPIKTVYEYDLSDIANPLQSGGRGMPNEYSSNTRYIGSHATSNTSGEAGQTQRYVLDAHRVSGYFEETIWDKAPLKKKTLYRYNAGAYTPETEETYYYSIDKEPAMTIGLFAEGLTRSTKSANTIAVNDVYDNVTDVNFFNITLRCGRSFRDSTEIVHYYADGTQQRTTTRYNYNGRGTVLEILPFGLRPIDPDESDDNFIDIRIGEMKGFDCDTIHYDSNHALLQAEQTQCGDFTFDRYLCYTSNVRDNSLISSLASQGRFALPVIERYVVNHTDTIDVHTHYSRYINPSNVQKSYVEIRHNGREITRRDYADYDRHGNLLETSVDGAAPTSYLWGYASTLPVAKVDGSGYSDFANIASKSTIINTGEGNESNLESILAALRAAQGLNITSYDYTPLVGCTKITAPNGANTTYGYQAGRLASISDHQGTQLKAFDFTMAGEGGGARNMTSETIFKDENGSTSATAKSYYDIFGMPTINIGIENTSSTIRETASTIAYDAIGRKIAESVATPIDDASSKRISQIIQAAKTYYSDDAVETTYGYDGTSLGNATSEQAPGEEFADHPKQSEIGANSNTLHSCIRLTCDAQSGAIRNTGNYSSGELTVATTTDEDGNLHITFTDRLGNTILDRRGSEGNWLDTYYVYDNSGLLQAVLPPKATIPQEGSAVSTDDINRLAYLYRYDSRDRMSARKLPGCEWEYMAYDRVGRRIFYQDGKLRSQGKTRFEVFDRLGRSCLQGICNSTNIDFDAINASQMTVTAQWAGGTNLLKGYTLNVEGGTLPSISYTRIIQANYYDNYDFLGSNGVPTGSDARVIFGAESGYGSRHGNAKGMLTGSLTAKYDGESVSDMLYAVNYYDYNGRIVETHSSKHNSEYETARYAYNLAGKVLKQHTIRYNSSLSELSNDVYAYSYDAGDRVLSATLSHNGATPQAIENCSYDGLGRMNQRICPADTVSTQYNIRGWVTRITEGRRFEQVLSYAAGEQSRFNGNISRNLWKHSASDSYSSYTYAYDNADRLVEAVYSGIGDFSTAYAYDANCNITAISRGGMETEVNGSRIDIDDLVLRYNGNQLTRVTDSGEDSGGYGVMEFIDRSNVANEYAYDANGNMTRDLNKGISNITYNLLNLPGEITFSDGRKVKYIYTADGAKVRTTYFDATGSQTLQVDYLGNYILRNGVVDRILTSSGYIKNDTVYSYVKDYQGNVRSVVRQDGAVVESNDYYPYGTPFTTANSVQPYKYGAKELDRMHGLDLYDSQARWYDALTGRTSTLDPKAEKYYNLSPYTWCAGNPVRFIDSKGEAIETLWDLYSLGTGAASLVDNIKTGNVVGAIVDGVGVVADAIAVAIPGAPGGAGAAIKAYRVADKAIDPAKPLVKATKNNYRKALQKATGKTGKGFDAHHTLPQKHRSEFENLGINIDEPGNVVWRETKNHRSNSKKVSDDWDKIFIDPIKSKNYTKEQILNFRNEIETKIFGNSTGTIPDR